LSENSSKSDRVRTIIEDQFKKDKEFFKEKINRQNFRTATLEALGLNDKKGKNLYSKTYTRVLKAKRINNSDFNETRFRRDLKNSEFKNVKITAKPSGITEPRKTQVETIKEEIEHEHPQLASSDKQEIDSELENFEQTSHLIPVESISIFWDGVWHLMKLKWSMIAPLKPQERESLGKMWQPFFEKHTSEKFVILGIPLIMTFGIFAGKIREALRIRREKQLEEKQKQEEKQKEKSKSEKEGSK